MNVAAKLARSPDQVISMESDQTALVNGATNLLSFATLARTAIVARSYRDTARNLRSAHMSLMFQRPSIME